MKSFLILAATIAVAMSGTVDPSLYFEIRTGSTFSAILELPQVMEQIEANPSLSSLSGDAKAISLVAALKGLTSATQSPFLTVASSLGLETRAFWGSNVIHVKGLNSQTLAVLAAIPGEFTIRKPAVVQIMPSLHVHKYNNLNKTVQWGVDKIRATEVWNLTQGEGVVVAVIDTGVNVGHVALTEAYAGAWKDPYYDTLEPTDIHGHGTHCTGTILGRENGVGVAPAAKWIACRGLNHLGWGYEYQLLTCAEWVLTANPTPHIVSNSWGGGSGETWYNAAISAWRAAGIIPVFAIGNNGPLCNTVISPGDQPNLISVGATTETDGLAWFSSRGPNAQGELKPDVSAPGEDILSCGTGRNDYVYLSGTSMACDVVYFLG
ncbi:bacillopeptidase F [Folsomia candida]|uniref:bacillopeptidase F n=1 Tax=Folsomia candida TaxID=158441 RepID=UPI0016053453|nr:bacillopeptidase F [Folsomia candida]